LLGPAGLRRQPDLNEKPQGLIAPAIFHKTFQLMIFGQDPHRRGAWEGAIRQYFREFFANLFQVPQYALRRTPIGPGNENKFRTQVSAHRF